MCPACCMGGAHDFAVNCPCEEVQRLQPMGHAQSKPPTAPISLKQLADHLSLSPATVSLVVNNAPGIRTIAMATRARVLAAAKEFNYHPNRLARSLRTRQTFTIGVIVPERSEGDFSVGVKAGERHIPHTHQP